VYSAQTDARARARACAIDGLQRFDAPRARWFPQFLTISVWFPIETATLRSRPCARLVPSLPFLYFLYLGRRSPRAIRRAGAGQPRLSACLSLSLSLSLSPPLFSRCPVIPAETMRVRFHNIEQSFISGFERRDAHGEGKQNVRQLLNVAGAGRAGWILPVRLLKIIGNSHRGRVAAGGDRGEGIRIGSVCVCVCTVAHRVPVDPCV